MDNEVTSSARDIWIVDVVLEDESKSTPDHILVFEELIDPCEMQTFEAADGDDIIFQSPILSFKRNDFINLLKELRDCSDAGHSGMSEQLKEVKTSRNRSARVMKCIAHGRWLLASPHSM